MRNGEWEGGRIPPNSPLIWGRGKRGGGGGGEKAAILDVGNSLECFGQIHILIYTHYGIKIGNPQWDTLKYFFISG